MKQVLNSIQLMSAGYGHKKVTVQLADQSYLSATTDNVRLTDKYQSDDDNEVEEAKKDLIDFVMSKNNIDEYEIV